MTNNHYEAYDDTSNDPLTPSMVRGHRLEELELFKDIKIYEDASLSEFVNIKGKPPIDTRWIDPSNGDAAHPN